MKLNIDLHCHSRFSADGVADPEEMVQVAKERGLQGFAITDHNTCACVDYFLQLGLMREDGLPVDNFLIIPGQEITTSAGHLLALGVRLPDLKGIDPSEAVKIIHEHGGLAIPPHPYDYFRAGIREATLQAIRWDAIEVFNAATTFRHCNRRAYEFALGAHLPMTAGSDAHHAEMIGIAYTILDADEFSVNGVLRAIQKGPERMERYLRKRDALRKTWRNLFRKSYAKKVKQSSSKNLLHKSD
ncbi:MAG: PHP domain-containing protein [Methylacidiphilales bacterium]|nr:PHP domain-containing protein [Candidatus Methylacidiphilales bacterium]MDW8349443.1 PHP domain-containing protein [Verrucomicrobiae bacterium]